MKTLTTALLAAILAFSLPSYAQNSVDVIINTDCWGGEVSWEITDDLGTVLASVGTNTYGNQIADTTNVDLPDGCYTFTISDSYGDGMAGSLYGSCGVDGYYKLEDSALNLLAEMAVANYGDGASHAFNVPFGSVAGCTDIEADNYDSCADTDDGSCVYPPLEAVFSYDAGASCGGSTVQFTDESIGNPTSYSWTFPGGDPATSTDPNPSVVYNAAGTFTATLEISNGTETVSSSTDLTIADGITLDIVIVPDNYPQETSWELADEDGNVIATGDVNGQSVCIADNCHQFTIYDSFGDGICCGYGEGSFTLLLNGVEVGTGGNFGDSQTINVNCPPGFDCNNPIDIGLGEHTAPVPNSWYTFTPVDNGQYRITTCDRATCDTKIWVYDYCNMENFDDTNEAAITYNDDFCGVQAEITPLLAAGETYYIRMGDTDSACGTDPLDFALEYMGPIQGCTDPLACNYLPIAEIPDVCYFPGDPECPTIGPDLEILNDVFHDSMFLTSFNSTDECYINEGCIQGFGQRDIVRFTTHIKNIGTEDYFIGDPGDNPDQFEFDDCHNHWHYEGYAEYVLYDETGVTLPEIGFKNGFCVLDLECSDGGTAKYTCGNMGITAGCGDIYSSGLACQWVDITDLDAGSYTIVMRTNWDFSPDANGSYELSYDNNWGAVCISFDRDVDGNVIDFTKSLDCPLIFDCLGNPFGNAQPDCAGNCPGVLVKGDVDGTGDLEFTDADQYVQDILGGDAVVSDCTDLDADGVITVSDAALAAGCVFYGPDHVDEMGVQDHCIWSNEVINPNHTTTLSIGDINETDGYVDVHVLNPDAEIVGYQFEVSGITIQSVENLLDPLVYDITPQASLGGTEVVGLSYSDQLIPKNLTPAPLMRIYYSTITSTEVCVSNIVDIVNIDYHNTMTVIGSCMSLGSVHFADFSADQTDICQGSTVTFSDLSATGTDVWSWNFPGGTPASSTDPNPSIAYNNPGTYDVTLTASNSGDVDSETKVGYIVVSAASTWYLDSDDDGYGDINNTIDDCDQPAGYVANSDDCDDTEALINPDAEEVCDGIDNNCDGITDTDATDQATWYLDSDEDGFGDAANTMMSCDQPEGYVSNDEDCDDTNEFVNPDADEVCDGIDNNCDGVTDTDAIDPTTFYADVDEDGYGDAENTFVGCSAPAGFVDNDLDCDDTNEFVNPDADEICDGIDNNCDGVTDTDAIDLVTSYLDADNDGFGDDMQTNVGCDIPEGYSAIGGDCDDTNDAVYPGAPGTGEGLDNNCNGAVEGDEIAPAPECMGDLNGDGLRDVADLLTFLAYYGCTEDCELGDVNGDGVVNQTDLLDFLPVFGVECPE